MLGVMMTIMVKLLNIIVTFHTPQNKVSDSITHVTLNTMNGVVGFERHYHRNYYCGKQGDNFL
jgi:hypothetical protein